MLRLTWFPACRGRLLLVFLAWMLAGAGSGQADRGQADLERLKQRVNEYFSAVHARRFTRASQFILPGSRDAGEAARPGRARIGNLRIHEIKLEEGSGSAVVSISRQVSAPAGSVRVEEKLRWKKEAGEWFLDPADPPRSDAEIFTEYYYKKRGSRYGGEVRGNGLRFRPESSREIPFGSVFPFATPSSQDLVVEKIHDPEPVSSPTGPKNASSRPESRREIHLELNTARLRRRFSA